MGHEVGCFRMPTFLVWPDFVDKLDENGAPTRIFKWPFSWTRKG